MNNYVCFRYLCDAKQYQEENGGVLAYKSKHHPERTKLYNQIIIGEGLDKNSGPFIIWKPKSCVIGKNVFKVEIERIDDFYYVYAVEIHGITIYSAIFSALEIDNLCEWLELVFNDFGK